MLELMRHNIQLNKLESKATASILDWYVEIFAAPTGELPAKQRPSSVKRRMPIVSWQCCAACH
jgi:hypothetical protein